MICSEMPQTRSRRSHENFFNDPSYDPMVADLASLRDGDGPFYNCYLRSAKDFESTTLTQLFQSAVPKVTKVRILHFSPEISSSESSTFKKVSSTFYHIVLGEAQGLSCVAVGWVVEGLENNEVSAGKSKAFSFIEGWKSLDEQKNSLDQDLYKSNPRSHVLGQAFRNPGCEGCSSMKGERMACRPNVVPEIS